MEQLIYSYNEDNNMLTAYQEYNEILIDGIMHRIPMMKGWKGQCQYKRKLRSQTISIARFFPDHRGKVYITEWNPDTKIATFEGNGSLLYKGVEVDKLEKT